MRHALALLRRFRSDQRGAFLAMFGLIAVVLVATSGAVVDFVSIEQARTRAQLALDAAALALQPDIYTKSNDTLKTEAQALLVERVNDASIAASIETVVEDEVAGMLRLTARITVPTAFMQLLGVQNISAGLVSEATRNRSRLEVVMVLDNSGSMSASNRMGNLKIAAGNATEILFGGQATLPNLFVGIVPFTQFVNVGTNNASASWMDRTAAASLTRDNFDDDNVATTPFTAPFDRIGLFSTLSGVSWAGCVEARRSPYDTNDTTPSASTPDTLFTPAFSPDEIGTPGTASNWPNSYLTDTPSSCPVSRVCGQIDTTTGCNGGGNVCSGPTTTQRGYGFFYQDGSVSTVETNCTCATFTYDQTSITGTGNNRTKTRTRYCDAPLTMQETQERLCKYQGAIDLRGRDINSGSDDVRGPNADCPVNAVLPLTNIKANVLARINAMVASGGTNIQQGAVWGYHVLTPTEPFTSGLPGGEDNIKVMILMTDGENVAYSVADGLNGSNVYSAYGYPRNNRLGAYGWSKSQLEAEMNTRTVTTCANAKASGIVIYTIGLASPNATTQQMLKDCASGPDYWYFPNDPTEMNAIFGTIASELAQLRLAR